MSKTNKRILSVILCLLMLSSSVSCSDSTNSSDSESSAKSENTSSAEESTETMYADSLGEELDFGGQKVRFITSRDARDIEVDTETMDMADVVNEALWKRNNLLEERLGVDVVLSNEVDYDNFNTVARNTVASNADDYDVFVVHQRFGLELAAEGLMKNLGNVNYLDFSQNYWNELVYKNLSYNDIHYWATGDLSLDYIKFTYAIYANQSMWNQYWSDESLYDIVMSGKWTIDELITRIENTYVDKNGDGKRGIDDTYGFFLSQGMGAVNSLLFGAGLTFTKYDADGTPMINLDSEYNIDVFTKVHDLVMNNTNFYRSLNEGNNEAFTENRTMFTMNCFYFMEDEKLREMDEDFLMLPMPKYDESQEEYRSNQHDGIGLYGVPITADPDNLDGIGATLEAMASMSSTIVYPAYYETSLKDKYTRNPETQELIDLIHDTILCDFCYAWGDTLGGKTGSIMGIYADNIQRDSITAFLQKKVKSSQTNLESLFEKFEDNAVN